MINRYLYGDLSEAVKKKCHEIDGGWKFLGFLKLSKKASEEHLRIMKLPISEIYEFLKK